jgi:hypothetical protein
MRYFPKHTDSDSNKLTEHSPAASDHCPSPSLIVASKSCDISGCPLHLARVLHCLLGY